MVITPIIHVDAQIFFGFSTRPEDVQLDSSRLRFWFSGYRFIISNRCETSTGDITKPGKIVTAALLVARPVGLSDLDRDLHHC